MAMIDVIRFRGPENAIIWKWFPANNNGRRQEELRLGSQLVVDPSFIAVFVNGGEIADFFGPGTHTLSTKNLPILTRLISIPFGKESPFKAEIFFINKAVVLDTKFYVPSFNMLDPNFRVPIPIEVQGSFGVRAGEIRSFMTNLRSSQSAIDSDRISAFFTGLICEKVKSAVTKEAKAMNLTPMELEASVAEVAERIRPAIGEEFSKYGLRMELFNIEAISIVADDPNVKRVIDNYHKLMSDDMAERLRLRRRKENLDVYKIERTFDTTEKAAENIGNGVGGDGGLLGTIVGLGVAQPLAGAMSGVMGNALAGATQPAQPTAAKVSTDEHIALLKQLAQLKEAGVLTEQEYNAKKAQILAQMGL